MLVATQRRLLQDALALTRDMLELAQREQWEALPDMETRRQELIRVALATPVAMEDRAQVSEGLSEILRLHGEVMALAVSAQRALGERLAGVYRGRRAQLAYANAVR